MPTILQPETPRLLLRQWRAEDRAPLAAMGADPRVMEHFPALLTTQQSHALADRCQAAIARQGWGLWAVEEKSSGALIGFVGLKHAPDELPFAPCVEVGWRLAFDAWGKGYATEAAREALRVGFENVELPEIVSFTALSNTRSQAVMQRLGMTRADHTFDHPLVPEGHVLREHCLFRMTLQQWRDRSARD